ncbi:MAG: TolC family protein, partial [Bdellovibrionales bacterium]|nr:TolC family protein [Bdellovibrionales bacterium]
VQREINKLDTDLIRKKNLPEISVSSGISYGSSQYVGTGQTFNDNDRLNWNALLTIKYNLWDWGIRSNNTEASLTKNIILNNDLKSELLILKSDINQFMINSNQVKRNYDLAKELLSLERNNLNFIEVEYRNGKIQYLDLITGLNNLTDAQVKFFTASSDLLSIKYTSLYHQGKLYDELIK